MPTRRAFIAGAAAAGMAPVPTWAEAGSPRYLSAARMPDGRFRLFGLDGELQPVLSLPLPGRGHAAVAHPERPEAVAFARRPGTFAIVLDCMTRSVVAALDAPPERHFYGHGAFSVDGARLYTTENAYEIGEGRIGVWAVDDGYRRIGEFASGGIGPHDIARLPGTDTLVVANGGIDTHPDTGREKLNIATMRPNLSYLTDEGEVVEQAGLPPDARMNSIRHLAVRPDGLVAFGCQWQGDLAAAPPVLGLHRRRTEVSLVDRPTDEPGTLHGYVGSIAFAHDGETVGLTSPRGGKVMRFNVAREHWSTSVFAADVCGIAPGANGFAITTGTGTLGHLGNELKAPAVRAAWDNHLVSLNDLG